MSKLGGGTVFDSIMSVIEALITGLPAGGGEEAVDGAVGWAGQFLNLIATNQTLILFCIAIPLVGLGIGIIRRLVKIRA